MALLPSAGGVPFTNREDGVVPLISGVAILKVGS
jgi:hypothetical protein